MPLEYRKTSKWWYGRYEVNGKRHCVNLGIRISGTPPASLLDQGDATFERSRGLAQAKLDQISAEARGTKTAEAMVQQLHEIKYGSKIQTFPIKDLVDAWTRMPKKRRSLHPRYVVDVHATLRRFVEFVQNNHPHVVEAGQVTRQIARAFLDAEEDRGVAEKSWNDTLKRLKATFRFLQNEHGLPRNPFDGITARTETNIHRRPFTEEEIKKLLEAAEHDDFVRPLIVCGLSTAMRRGDCCLLKWESVILDGPRPTITVKTSKTGETVCIPIYERLWRELNLARDISFGKSEYVWPEQAQMQLENQQGVTWRLRQVFEAALGSASLQAERAHGIRKASIKDFHSLRTTWITEALSRGVPIETVKLISGHRTTEVVTEHYFHPDQEQVRRSLEAAMPKLLTNGNQQPKDAIFNILDHMTAKTWKKDAARVRELLAAL